MWTPPPFYSYNLGNVSLSLRFGWVFCLLLLFVKYRDMRIFNGNELTYQGHGSAPNSNVGLLVTMLLL